MKQKPSALVVPAHIWERQRRSANGNLVLVFVSICLSIAILFLSSLLIFSA